jgi:hypothetical protein
MAIIRWIYATGFCAALMHSAGCARATQPGDENPFPQRQNGAEEPWRPGDPLPGQKGGGTTTANFAFEMQERQWASYLDLTKPLEYRFLYLTVVRTGSIQFVGGVARIQINDLPVGQSGDLTLKIYESGVEKLAGTRPNTTLIAGQNPIDLTMKLVGDSGGGGTTGGGGGGGTTGGGGNGNIGGTTGGGNGNIGGTTGGGGNGNIGGGDNLGGGGNNGGGNGSEAELTLEISFVDQGGGAGNSGGDSTPAVTFAQDIAPLAQQLCSRCHQAATTEAFWTVKKIGLLARLQSGATGEMPQAGSPEASAISDAQRQKMLRYLRP